MAEDNGNKGGKLKTIIIVTVALILAIGLSVAGTLWFLGGSGDSGGDGAETADGQAEKAETHTPASYFRLEDALVVAVDSRKQRYLQVNLAFVMREHDVSSALERHLPTVRSRLRTLLQKQSYKELRTTQGKKQLQKDMLKVVNKVLKSEHEKPIERVLFTNFVMQ
ncbi:flagellar basal body-associated FliL family protein [Halomonadaceae bacterium KBTZ08]